MMKEETPPVLIVAYACTPGGASEHGLGWQWVEKTAATRKVVLVTRPGREGLPEACREKGIELCEVPVPQPWKKWTQGFGDIGIWMRIYFWAVSVRREIKKLNQQ